MQHFQIIYLMQRVVQPAGHIAMYTVIVVIKPEHLPGFISQMFLHRAVEYGYKTAHGGWILPRPCWMPATGSAWWSWTS